jgi:hypothetical protein
MARPAIEAAMLAATNQSTFAANTISPTNTSATNGVKRFRTSRVAEKSTMNSGTPARRNIRS